MSRALNVLHVTDTLPHTHAHWGGAEQAAARLIAAEAAEGIALTVVTTRPDTTDGTGAPGVRYEVSPTLDDYIGGRLVGRLRLRHLGVDPVSYRFMRRLMRRIRPDAVHLHRTVALTLSAAAAAQTLGIPVVCSVYDYFNFCARETLVNAEGRSCRADDPDGCVRCIGGSALIAGPLFRLRKALFSAMLKTAVFHVLSDSSASIVEACGIGRERIRKVLQVFELGESRTETETAERGRVLYIGWVQERKGLHVILEAMPEILKKAPWAHLVAVGDIKKDAYFKRIQQTIERLGLRDRVSLLGKKDYAEVARQFARAEVVVIPEQWENMSPVVLIEAMSHAKPVVASRIGGIPEFVDDGASGLLADPSSAAEFAGCVSSLLLDEARALGIGAEAARHIRALMDRKTIMLKYRELYEYAIKRASA